MQRAIRPEWLLRQADELVGSGRGQPRNADLRRATSAAYYALFHRIALDGMQHLFPDGSHEEIGRAVRYLTHASVRQVCGWIAGETPPKHVTDVVQRLRLDPDVTFIAVACMKLQDEREVADYDHFGDFTRPATRALVDQACEATELLEGHWQRPEVRMFLGLVALRTSIR